MKKIIYIIKSTKVLIQIVFLSFCFLHAFSAGTQQYKFTNNENATATDLHIEFSTSVTFHLQGAGADPTVENPAGTFANGNGSGTTSVDFSAGVTGTGVLQGGSVTLTFDYAGVKTPTVVRWCWTKSNSTDYRNADKLGQEKRPKGDGFIFAKSNSYGNGVTSIVIAGELHTFYFPPAVSGFQMAEAFYNFISAQPFAIAERLDSFSVCVSSAGLSGNDNVDLNTNVIQQDNYQFLTLQDCSPVIPPNVIPTLSQWGLILMAAILLAIGSFLIIKKPKPLT